MQDRVVPDGALDEGRHDGDSEPAAGHDENLDEFAPALKVLSHHQSAAVSRHAHSDADDGAVAEE